MSVKYIKTHAIELSLDEQINESLDDDGSQMQEMIAEEERQLYMRCLTRRQQQVAELLFTGYKRSEIAKSLVPPVGIQAVHQMVLRIRKRLMKRAISI